MSPRARRRPAGYLRDAHARPVGRARALAGLARSTWYYRARQPARDAEVAEIAAALRALAEAHPTRGFDNYYARLRAVGRP